MAHTRSWWRRCTTDRCTDAVHTECLTTPTCSQLIHGRWAMLAAVGALAPELMSLTGAIPPETGLPWFVAGGLFSDSREGWRGRTLAAMWALMQSRQGVPMQMSWGMPVLLNQSRIILPAV
jgi:hypothetical protein